MSLPLVALIQGIVAASSLLVGAVLGIGWRPARGFTAAIMAFGSGTLLSAIAFDITLPVFNRHGFWPLVVGFTLGGTLFTVIVSYIDARGGFIRHPSSSRRFLYQHRPECVIPFGEDQRAFSECPDVDPHCFVLMFPQCPLLHQPVQLLHNHFEPLVEAFILLTVCFLLHNS